MQADYIQKIIDKLNDLPYKCILFNGIWGIGKSYAVDKALKKKTDVCKISLFGLQGSQQIYHEVLFQLALRSNMGGKIGEIAFDVWESLSKVSDKAAQAKEVFSSIAKEKEMFLLLSKKFEALHIIVIDDLERISDNINLEEVLGIVEELKQCNYTKVILVANLQELSEENEQLFGRYYEKVIDKIYNITERPDHVAWHEMGIDTVFVEKFLKSHQCKNLRTLEKAQNFYDDVKLYIADTVKADFLTDIKWVCYAIVVESIDNLYYKLPEDNEKDNDRKFMRQTSNQFENRLLYYLTSVRISKYMVSVLSRYYNNQIELDKSEFDIEYELFLNAGKKKNFYKTDKQIMAILPELYDKLCNAENIGSLNKYTDEYVHWNEVLENDVTEVLDVYRKTLRTYLRKEIEQGNEDYFNSSYHLWSLSSESVKKAYEEECNLGKKGMIEYYIDVLAEDTRGEKAYKYSRNLKGHWSSTIYRGIIEKKIDKLYTRKSFPVDDTDDRQYSTCYNIMYILYQADAGKFDAYCGQLKKDCDKMSAYRINKLTEEIKSP